MEKAVRYLGNDFEDAVIKVMDNGDRYVKFFRYGGFESKAHPKSKVAYGSIEYDLINISEEDYESFGKSWHYGGLYCERTERGFVSSP